MSSALEVLLKLVVLNTRLWAGISLLPQYSFEFLLVTVKWILTKRSNGFPCTSVSVCIIVRGFLSTLAPSSSGFPFPHEFINKLRPMHIIPTSPHNPCQSYWVYLQLQRPPFVEKEWKRCEQGFVRNRGNAAKKREPWGEGKKTGKTTILLEILFIYES